MSTNVWPAITAVRTVASTRKDRLIVPVLQAIHYSTMVTRPAPTWTSVPTRHYPISDARIIAST